MNPRIILHNAVSLDGRIDRLEPDLGLFYELATQFNEDATLAGSETILTAPVEIPDESPADMVEPPLESGDSRPFLVICDSRGRIKSWHFWRRQPYWKGFISLCSHATPKKHVDYLSERRIPVITTGNIKVDLEQALEQLYGRFGIKTVRVDSGGTLNGLLLRMGLVDEISLLIHPVLIGGISPLSFFRAPDLTSSDEITRLELSDVQRLKDNLVWLRYSVVKDEK